MNLRRKFLLQRIDIPSFDYNRTEIKPYINTFCIYTNISPWLSIVIEKGFVPSEAQHVMEQEGEVMNIKIEHYQYRTISRLEIALVFKCIVKVG